MSDSSSDSNYSGSDPDYEYDSSDQESDIVSSSVDVKTNQSVDSKNASPLKCGGRSASPSSINAINLSESDSSEDESVSNNKPTEKGELPSTSSYFTPNFNSAEEKTNYDFSHIIDVQNRLSKAREEYNKQIANNSSQAEPSFKSTDDCSISDLLAKGEKTSIFDSLTESESEEELTTPTTVEITLPTIIKTAELNKSKRRKAFLEKQLQIVRRENQILLHKAHLLCLLAHGNYLNSFIINNEMIHGYLFSLLPERYTHPQILSEIDIKHLLVWFEKIFSLKKPLVPISGVISIEHLIDVLANKGPITVKVAVIFFVAILRSLGCSARLVISLQPLSLRTQKKKVTKSITTKTTSNATKLKRKSKTVSVSKNKPESISVAHKVKQMNPTTSSKPKTIKSKLKQPKSSSSSPLKTTGEKIKQSPKAGCSKLAETSKQKDESLKNRSQKTPVKSKNIASRKKLVKVLSPDSDEETELESNKNGVNYWVEVYIEDQEKWICVDMHMLKVASPDEICLRATQPVLYIIGWKNDNTLKDVTRRYVPDWQLKSKNIRIDQEWWLNSLKGFYGKDKIMDKKEDEHLEYYEANRRAPIPTKISLLKNHPLYALQRHLLKFQGIYPADAVPLGYIRGEPVYSRFCVHELFSREKWLRQGKCVRVNEKPYKIVKSRSNQNKFAGTEKPLELFGHWQVEDYIAPPAVDGKVPRNEYGNVEVYKPSMLPAGTVHLHGPGLQKVANKMKIDCAPAVIGWEHHTGRSHPVIDGIVVCKEFQDALLDAWNAEIDASAQRSGHKRRQAIYKSWLKVTKHVIIKANLKKKYNFGESKSGTGDEPPKKLPKKT